MKENIILFIIIGIFLFTVVIFKNKEGFTSTTKSQACYSALTDTKTALTAASNAATADFATKYATAKAAVTDLNTKAIDFNTEAAASSDNENKNAAIVISTAVATVKTSFDSATTDTLKSSAVNSAITSLSAIIIPTTSTSSSSSTVPLGDTCSNKTNLPSTNCEWNSNPSDNSDWWNEHRSHESQAVNNVKWNTHTTETVDYVKYPFSYRNPTDKTNGPVSDAFIAGYLMNREKEAMEGRLNDYNNKSIQSKYDVSMNTYKQQLENNAKLITSINDEKERMKRDLSNNSTRTVYSDDYDYVYEEEEGLDGSTCPSLKCIADFGTNIGENLCCGQTGVLQNTEYVCPSVKPTCQNFKCGSKFGTCV